MKKDTKDFIVESLNAFIKRHDLSAAQVAERTGINASYLSQMRAGKYTATAGKTEVAIQDKYYQKVADYIGLKIEKSYWSTVQTPQLIGILATLEDSKKYATTSVVIGETGSGKSFTANMFMKVNPVDTWVVKVGSSDNLGDLLNKVLDQLGIAPGNTKSRRLADIIKTLKGKKENGQSPMLIFDECEYMKLPALHAMKELYDNLIGITSIVMLGTDQLIRNIDRLRKSNKSGIPQLYRRIKFGIRKLPVIDRSYKLFLKDIEPGLRRMLIDNCDNYGELHDVLVPSFREAERIGQPVTENFVRTVLNMPN